MKNGYWAFNCPPVGSADPENYISSLKNEGYQELIDHISTSNRENINIPIEGIKRHVHICGATGSGKSTLIKYLVEQLIIKQNHGTIIIVDPHGEICDTLINSPLIHEKENLNKLIYLSLSECKSQIPIFNPLQITNHTSHDIALTVEQIILALEEILDRSSVKLTEVQINMLEKCLYFLIQRKNSSLLDLETLLSQNDHLLHDEAIDYNPQYFNEHFFKSSNKTKEALRNRVQRMLNSPVLRTLFGGESKIDLSKIINQPSIFLVNLSGMGELSATVAGKFLIACIKSTVFKRKKGTGIPVYCLIDEAQNLTSGSLELLLSGARGFGLHLILANQHLKQFGQQLESVKENTSVKILTGLDNTSQAKPYVDFYKQQQLNPFDYLIKERNKNAQIFKLDQLFLKEQEHLKGNKSLVLKRELLLEGQKRKYYTKIEQPINRSTSKNSLTPPFKLNINLDNDRD